MIRFCGKINSQYENDIIALRGKQAGMMCLVSTAIMAVLGVIMAIVFHSIAEWYEFFIYVAIALVVGVVLFVTARPKRNPFAWDYDITIREDIIKIIWNHQNGVVTTKPLKKIKKVVDYGGYYLLLVTRWDASNSIICQKDLLVEGSIEEFESIFAGKIQVKNNQKK